MEIEPVVARTLTRSWHELHEARLVPHDFLDAVGDLPPKPCYAAVLNDEIRAIGMCGPESALTRVTHPPGGELGGHALVTLLLSMDTDVDWKKMRAQPRWLLACSFYGLSPAE